MRVLFFPFFITWLAALNLSFFTKVFFTKVSFLKLIFVVALLVSVSGFFMGKAFTIPLEKTSTPLLYSNPDLNLSTSQTQQELLTTENIEAQVELHEKLLKKQPTHRDALLNLYILENIQGNTDKAQIYLDQALQADPNNPVFVK